MQNKVIIIIIIIIIIKALFICISTQKFENMADLHGQMRMFWTLIFRFNSGWIQLCGKKNLTFVDCCDFCFIKLVLKNVIKLDKSSLNNIFQHLFNKILIQQLTHDRSYLSKTC